MRGVRRTAAEGRVESCVPGGALTAALLAKGPARGVEGVVRAVLAAGILVMPGISPGIHILLLSPDHTGIAVPLMLALLLADRARPRWFLPVAMGVLLVWAGPAR